MGKFVTDKMTAFVHISSIIRGNTTETKGANLDNPLNRRNLGLARAVKKSIVSHAPF